MKARRKDVFVGENTRLGFRETTGKGRGADTWNPHGSARAQVPPKYLPAGFRRKKEKKNSCPLLSQVLAVPSFHDW